MSQTATIRFNAGSLLLPASDPYEREVVFEQADFYARRHGAALVQLGDAKLRAAHSGRASGVACARCHHPLRAVSFEVAERQFCIHCAKYAVRC
jgi:hypothetical protein